MAAGIFEILQEDPRAPGRYLLLGRTFTTLAAAESAAGLLGDNWIILSVSSRGTTDKTRVWTRE